jgi:hypothetical protein
MKGNVVAYWKELWEQNKVLFWVEAIGIILAMAAAILLAKFAVAPPLMAVFALNLISDILLAYSSYCRRSAFLLLLMIFYSLTSTYGIIYLCI